MISPQIIEQLRDSISLVDYLNSIAGLKKNGRIYKGLCPFHTEKTPSFVVYPEQNRFHCFGCGKHGDIITCLQELEGLSFREAVENLASRAGIVLDMGQNGDDGTREERSRLIQLNRDAAAIFKYALTALPAGEVARKYLTGRGVLPQSIEGFQLGYALPGWDGMASALRGKSWADDLLVEAGLARRSKDGARLYDYFRDRVIFPIFDHKGDPVGFGGRILDQGEPKYLNTAENLIFQKRSVLYGYHLARGAVNKSDVAYITEGYLDVIGLHQAGIHNAVAPLGTSLTAEHLRRLKAVTRRLVFMFDGDSAGRKAVLRAAPEVFRQGFRAKVVLFPDGKDPFEIAVAEGAEKIFSLVKQGMPLSDFILNEIYRSKPPVNADATIEFLHEVYRFVAELDEEVTVSLLLRKAALLCNLELDALMTDFENFRREGKRKILPEKVPVANFIDAVQPDNRNGQVKRNTEFYLVRLVGLHSQLFPEMAAAAAQWGGFEDAAAQSLWQVLVLLHGSNAAWSSEDFVRLVDDPGVAAVVSEDAATGRLEEQWRKQFDDSLNRFKIEKIRKKRRLLAEEIKRQTLTGNRSELRLLQQQVLELRRQEEQLLKSKETG